jgi:hypothetical protein
LREGIAQTVAWFQAYRHSLREVTFACNQKHASAHHFCCKILLPGVPFVTRFEIEYHFMVILSSRMGDV